MTGEKESDDTVEGSPGREPGSNREVSRREALLGTAGSLLGIGAVSGAASESDDSEYAFADDFEDGTLSAWETTLSEGDFSASVVDQPADPDGQKAMRVTETTGGGTGGFVGWSDGVEGWSGQWTFSGAFYTEAVPLNSRFQGHRMILGVDPANASAFSVAETTPPANETNDTVTTGTETLPPASTPTETNTTATPGDDGGIVGAEGLDSEPLRIGFGFRDGSGDPNPFVIRGDLIDEIRLVDPVEWTEDTLYNYEIHHDGNGNYTGRVWVASEERPPEPTAESVGQTPDSGPGVAGVLLNGALGRTFRIDHTYVRFDTTPTGTPTPTPSPTPTPTQPFDDLGAVLETKKQLIDDVRKRTTDVKPGQTTIDESPESFVENTEESLDNGSFDLDETRNRTEAVERLIGGERVTRTAAGGPVKKIIDEMGNAAVNAALSATVELVSFGIGSWLKSGALDLLAKQVADSGRGFEQSFTRNFGSAATEFNNLFSKKKRVFAEQVEQYAEKNGLPEDPADVGISPEIKQDAKDAAKTQSPGILVNVLKGINEVAPKELVDGIRTEIRGLKDRIDQLAFRYYWLTTDLLGVDFEFEVPTVPAVPSRTFRLPFDGLPGLDPLAGGTAVETDGDEADQFESGAASLVDSLANVGDAADQLSDVVPVTSGIEQTLDNGVETLNSRLADNSLERQDPAERKEFTQIGSGLISDIVSVSDKLRSLIKSFLEGVMHVSLALGITVIVLYVATAGVAVASGVGSPAVVPLTGTLLSALALLGILDLILTVTGLALLGVSVRLIGGVHNVVFASIVTDTLPENLVPA